MDRQKITVTIAAEAGVGKSTIATIVKNALQMFGIDVVVTDEDPAPDATLAARVQGIRDRRVEVLIDTRQTKRRS